MEAYPFLGHDIGWFGQQLIQVLEIVVHLDKIIVFKGIVDLLDRAFHFSETRRI